MKIMQTQQRRILSKFQVDRFANVSAMSHRTRNLFHSVEASIVRLGASVNDGSPQTSMDSSRDLDDAPGRLVRQRTVPIGRSSLRRQGSMRRTKSFRVTFAEKIITNDGELANVCPPVTPPSPRVVKEETETTQRASTSKQKITHRKKPARRPTSHVPRSHVVLLDDDDDEKPTDPSSSHKETPPSPAKGDRRSSLSQFLDQNVLNPMEEKLRQLAIKYRKQKEVPKSRIPVPTSTSYKTSRVSSLASKFERQCSSGENK